MNHQWFNIGSPNRCGIAVGEAIRISSPPSRSQICGQAKRQGFAESGFGGWADEKTETAVEASLIRRRRSGLSRQKTSTTFDNISAKTLKGLINSVKRELEG